jgi:hypothetical protein
VLASDPNDAAESMMQHRHDCLLLRLIAWCAELEALILNMGQRYRSMAILRVQ